MTDVLTMLKEQLDPEEFRKLTETRQSLEKRFMRLESETNHIRILPAKNPGKLWFREVHNHFKVGGLDKKGVVACLFTEKNQGPCFIEDVIAFYRLSPNPVDQEYAKALRPSRIYWVNAYNAKADDPVVRIVPLSYTTFQQLFQLYMSGELSFLETGDSGCNVIITKQAGNKYYVRLDSNRGPIFSEELLEQRYDMDEVVQQQLRSYEEQMAMFPPELLAKMKAAGLIKVGGGAPIETYTTPPSFEGEAMPASDIRSQMDNLMKSAGKNKAGLDDI